MSESTAIQFSKSENKFCALFNVYESNNMYVDALAFIKMRFRRSRPGLLDGPQDGYHCCPGMRQYQ